MPDQVVGQAKQSFGAQLWSKLNEQSTKVSSKDRVFFLETLSTMMESGLDISSTLAAIRREAKTPKMIALVEKIQGDIDSGISFTDAMSKYNFLPTYSMSLVRAGEKSGRFSENLQVIVNQQTKDAEFSAKLKGAMMYPVIVMCVAVVVGLGLAWFVMPKLVKVFKGMGVKLPFTTRMLISVGEFVGKHGAIVIPLVLVVFATVMYLVFLHPKTRVIGQRLIMHAPGFKRVVLEAELARFGYLLGSLLGAGLPVLDSMDALEGSSSYLDYRNLYRHLRDGVEVGFTFEEGFATYKGSEKLIPASVQQIITTGERSGNMAKALSNVGRVYESKIANTTKNLSTVLEPMMLLIIFGGVMFIALAVIQPVYGLLSGVK